MGWSRSHQQHNRFASRIPAPVSRRVYVVILFAYQQVLIRYWSFFSAYNNKLIDKELYTFSNTNNLKAVRRLSTVSLRYYFGIQIATKSTVLPRHCGLDPQSQNLLKFPTVLLIKSATLFATNFQHSIITTLFFIQQKFVNLLKAIIQTINLIFATTANSVTSLFISGWRSLTNLHHGVLAIIRHFLYPWRHYPLESLSTLLFFALLFTGLYQLDQLQLFDLPNVESIATQPTQYSNQISDRHGTLLYQLYDEENRIPVSLSEVSPWVLKATVAIEDQDFWHHHGFSVRGLARAVMANLQGKPVQGGSTITQQLVKMRLLSNERTFERKIKELILAVQLEQHFTKPEILEFYLNQVAYGGTTYGIGEAAAYYFGKPASQLSAAEAALLAGLPAAPSAYTPYGTAPENSLVRQQEVLRRMKEDGYLSNQDYQLATAQPLVFKQQRHDMLAPHFVTYVIQRLTDTYGQDQLAQGGLIITTTLDYNLQKKVESIMRTEMKSLTKYKISNSASLVTNPQTGEVLSLVGGVDYYDQNNGGQVNVVLRPRQPGSAIKPITYATAFEQGLSPLTRVVDSPIVFPNPGSQPYAPKNYDGVFHGLVTLRQALGSSYNIPAVKVLNQIGVPSLLKKAQAMGITTWTEPERYGLALTLGGGDVTMLDMATAYGVLANAGKKAMLNPIRTIETFDGRIIYQNPCVISDCPVVPVLDPAVAYQVTHVLKDNNARIPAFGALSDLFIPNQEVAVKTGTTNSMRDNWTIGYTPNRLVATWVGNNDNSPMSYVASGVTGASPIWNKIMRSLLAQLPEQKFPVPDSVVVTKLCRNEEKLVCGQCQGGSEEAIRVEDLRRFGCGAIADKLLGATVATQSAQLQDDQLKQPFVSQVDLPNSLTSSAGASISFDVPANLTTSPNRL